MWVTARYHVGHDPVPRGSRPGTTWVTARYHVGHGPVPCGSRPGTTWVTARLRGAGALRGGAAPQISGETPAQQNRNI
ncbi:unnamed protein product [Boreogadus saida]